MKYLLTIPDSLSSEPMVNSEELAVALGHSSEDASTNLLVVSDRENNDSYVLRLCGTVKFKDDTGKAQNAHDLTVDQFRRLREAGGEFLANSWFEWIRGCGDTLLEPGDTIYTDPHEEIRSLAVSLGIDATRLVPGDAGT